MIQQPRPLSKLEMVIGPIGLTPEQKQLYKECKQYLYFAKDAAKRGKSFALDALQWVRKYMPVDLSGKINEITTLYNQNKAS